MAVSGNDVSGNDVSGIEQRTATDLAGVVPQQRTAEPAPAEPAGSAVATHPAGLREFGLDLVERAGWTAGQVFFASLLAGGTAITVANLPWKYAGVLAVSAGVASVVLTLLQYLGQKLAGRKITNFWADLLLRLAKTFLASLAGSFAAAHPFNITTFDWTTALNLGAIAVITALGKGLLARASDTGAAAQAGAATGAVRTPSTLPTRDYLAVQRQFAPADAVPAG